ncbi:hypothetical protein AB1484_27985 [Parafrankia sp. FMc6]|uniref:hypothetical protein n=1 Tax=Parafrankia soli TaxID=2599596 RepID=UPI0034D3F643
MGIRRGSRRCADNRLDPRASTAATAPERREMFIRASEMTAEDAANRVVARLLDDATG